MIEQPSQPIYLNEIDDTTREATYVAEASTQAQPALSPPSNQHRPKQPPPQPARPFTALIDQELANQRRLLDLTASKAAAHLQGIYIMYNQTSIRLDTSRLFHVIPKLQGCSGYVMSLS